MKNILIDITCIFLIAGGIAACGLAAKASINKCEHYAKGNNAVLRDCLGL